MKYTFRLELEDDGADDFWGKSLIERSACQAYKMFEPLIADRWSGQPLFLTKPDALERLIVLRKKERSWREKIKESDVKNKGT